MQLKKEKNLGPKDYEPKNVAWFSQHVGFYSPFKEKKTNWKLSKKSGNIPLEIFFGDFPNAPSLLPFLKTKNPKQNLTFKKINATLYNGSGPFMQSVVHLRSANKSPTNMDWVQKVGRDLGAANEYEKCLLGRGVEIGPWRICAE